MCPRTKIQTEEIRNKRRHDILETALRVFAEESYNGTSVSRIAREAGISKGLMYIYFDSKEALLHALLDDMIETMIRRYDMDMVDELTDDGMDRFIETSFRLFNEDRLHMKLFFSLFMQSDIMEIIMEKLLKDAGPFMQLLTEYFLRKGYKDPVAAMRYFAATIDGVMMHMMLDAEFPVAPVQEMIKGQFKKMR